jgi:hypothetical protein
VLGHGDRQRCTGVGGASSALSRAAVQLVWAGTRGHFMRGVVMVSESWYT